MNTIKNSTFVFLLTTLVYFFSTEVFSDPIEEIVVKGSWRQTSAAQEDSSVIFPVSYTHLTLPTILLV